GEPVPRAHPRYQTADYNDLVAKMLDGGPPEQMGDIADRCLPCGQGKPLVAMRWKSSLCLRCAKVYVANGGRQGSQVLQEGVLYRHIILTVPAMFRTTLYHKAAVVLSAWMRCGVQCLNDCYREVRGQALQGGSIVGIHPHGRNGHSPPQLHLLAPSGGYDHQGARGEQLQDLPSALLRHQWQWHGLRT